jgi:hypothetical protein
LENRRISPDRNPWDRVMTDLVESRPGADESKRDVSRMRSLLVHLKNKPL